MALHPVIDELLRKAASLPPMHTLPVEAVRAGDIARYAWARVEEEVAEVFERTIEGPRGDIRLRVYRPADEGARPLTVFFHGSGFCICSIETHDAICRQIARRSGSIVVSVDYRLAPENKYPAGPDDCFAATLWCAENAAELGGDAARLAVCGDSAGGNMAAVVALRARDAGLPPIKAQILLYPVIDHHSVERASWAERGTGYGLTAQGMRWFWDHYLTSVDEGSLGDVSPIRAESLAGLPAAYVVTAEYDLLRDEGEAYAAALAEAGVSVDCHRYADVNHGFLFWTGIVDSSMHAMDALGAWMRKTL